MYEYLEEQAREAGLELNWSARIPYSRLALAAAEAVRISEPEYQPAFNAAIFDAYFARGQDIEDWTIIAKCADDTQLEPVAFRYSMTSGIADNELRSTEAQARDHHITATPAWLLNGEVLHRRAAPPRLLRHSQPHDWPRRPTLRREHGSVAGRMTAVVIDAGHAFATVGDTTLALDVYPAPQADAPVVLYVHGGGWRSGGKADGATERLAPLAEYGVTGAARRAEPSGRLTHPTASTPTT